MPPRKEWAPHSRILDDRCTTSDDRIVTHHTMPGQHDVVREYDVAADFAVVPDVRVCKKRAAVANHSLHAAAFGARVDRHTFANDALPAHFEG